MKRVALIAGVASAALALLPLPADAEEPLGECRSTLVENQATVVAAMVGNNKTAESTTVFCDFHYGYIGNIFETVSDSAPGPAATVLAVRTISGPKHFYPVFLCTRVAQNPGTTRDYGCTYVWNW